MFKQAFESANLPGAVGIVVDRDGVRFAQALGVADLDSGTPVAEDTQFQIASMTKALVTLAAMQLVEAGKLDLDAPVLPSMSAGAIAMQSGLANANGRWCNVDYLSFESTAAKDVHVIGDSVLAAPAMPKSGHRCKYWTR